MKNEKSKYLQRIIAKIEKTARKNKSRAWKAVAEVLSKPRRGRAEVNIGRIQRYAKENEVVVIPGKVLGSGKIDKKLTVVALSFSDNAVKKIREAGGKCIRIDDFINENPQGKGIRIMV